MKTGFLFGYGFYTLPNEIRYKEGGLLVDCALWLNRRKIRSASEIPQNLDVASLRGYFLAGSLVDWLCGHGGEDYAEKLRKIPADSPDLNEKIAAVFGGKPTQGKPLNGGESCGGSFVSGSSYNICSYPRLSSLMPSFGSFGSFREFIIKLGSYSSFYFTSGGFHEWEWEWLLGILGAGGSFNVTSFTSFRGMERLFGRLGSFGFGSFGSFPWNFGELFGSFMGANLFKDLPALDEYDLIMLETLMRCPLDRFGYGIHNI